MPCGVLRVGQDIQVAVNNLTIDSGTVDDQGGGIYNGRRSRPDRVHRQHCEAGEAAAFTTSGHCP
jgi:hypothetical protein